MSEIVINLQSSECHSAILITFFEQTKFFHQEKNMLLGKIKFVL